MPGGANQAVDIFQLAESCKRYFDELDRRLCVLAEDMAKLHRWLSNPMGEIAMQMQAEATEVQPLLERRMGQGLNVIQLAIYIVGGVDRATKLLDASPRTIYAWMKQGHMRGVPGETTYLLARKSGISIGILLGYAPTQAGLDAAAAKTGGAINGRVARDRDRGRGPRVPADFDAPAGPEQEPEPEEPEISP